MTQEEKQLLLIDLCARLPYGEWEYFVACQKELRQLELQILNNMSVPLDHFDHCGFNPYGIGIRSNGRYA